MNMNDLKSGEPFFGKWYIKDDIGSNNSSSEYLIYCIENGVCVYSAMKVLGVPRDNAELKQVRFDELNQDGTLQYYKEIVTDMYREICLIEKLNDKSHLVSYEEHLIYQRGNSVGYDIFLRMELLKGMKEGIQVSSMRNQEIIQLGKDICEALRVCEIYHIVHGDIRPDSIFVTSDGRFKLGDFSFSRNRSQATLSADNLGDYMAPEVYHGKSYDSRADIYSLGLILYQYLNDHKLPYLTVTLEEATREQRLTAIKRRFEESELPRPCNATNELARVIAKACEVNPKLRYQNAEEFKDALTAIGVFLGADLSSLVKDYTFLEEDIYVENEVVTPLMKPDYEDIPCEQEVKSDYKDIECNEEVEPELRQVSLELEDKPEDMIAATIDRERRKKRETDVAKEANAKNVGPWILSIIALVLSACAIVLITNTDFTKRGNSVNTVEVVSQSVTPTLNLNLEATPTMTPTQIPTVQPTVKPAQKPEEDPVDVTKPTITTIAISGQGLEDLATIEGIGQAVTIDFSNNKITDINALKDAVKVEILGLSNNQIASVEPLRDLVYLKALDLSKNSINSLAMLRKLVQLEVLSVSNNEITSLEGLEKLSHLKIIYLNDNQIDDITVLKGLTTLELIDLSNNKVKEKEIEALQAALPECIIIYK